VPSACSVIEISWIAGLLLLDGNAALADTDLDAALLPLLVELITEDCRGDRERANDEEQNIAGLSSRS
jgi:hypothetical protein